MILALFTAENTAFTETGKYTLVFLTCVNETLILKNCGRTSNILNFKMISYKISLDFVFIFDLSILIFVDIKDLKHIYRFMSEADKIIEG